MKYYLFRYIEFECNNVTVFETLKLLEQYVDETFMDEDTNTTIEWVDPGFRGPREDHKFYLSIVKGEVIKPVALDVVRAWDYG